MAQSAKDYLQGERTRKADEADAIVKKAEEEARPLTVEEKSHISNLLSEVESIDQRIDEMDENEKLREQIERMSGATRAPSEKASPQVRTIGEAFTNSDAFKALLEGGGLKSANWRTGPIEMPLGFKESVPGETLTPDTAPVVQPDVRPGIQTNLLQRLTIADLIPTGTTSSSSVKTIVESGFDDTVLPTENNAAAVSPTAEKPASQIALQEVDEPVRKIATFLPIADEMLEDIPALRSYLDGRLRLFVQHEEEDQLLNGNGNAPNLSGILDRDVQTGTMGSLAGTPLDAVYSAITEIRTNAFLEPDAVVVHPDDWQGFRLAKDLNEQYYGGGPFTGAYGNGGIAADRLWQLPAVVTASIAQGTVLVGAFRTAAQVFRRGGLTVEASNSHNDFFQRNMTAIRAEERLALAVYRPAGFYAITSVEFDS